MNRQKIGIVDFGVGNLLSVKLAAEKCGANAFCSSDPDQIFSADAVILPGVGAFGNAMYNLRQNGMNDALVKYAESRRPLLGICLGMQLLFDASEEFGCHEGLGLINGRVIAISGPTTKKANIKVPHIGWTKIEKPKGVCWEKTLLAKFKCEPDLYFVHSFMASSTEQDGVKSEAVYAGIRFPAYVQKSNIFGCQFHPEKSGTMGLKIIKNFVSIAHGV